MTTARLRRPAERQARASSRTPSARHPRLLYGSAFKAPSAYLLYAVPLKIRRRHRQPHAEARRLNTVEAELRTAAGEVARLALERRLQSAEQRGGIRLYESISHDQRRRNSDPVVADACRLRTTCHRLRRGYRRRVAALVRHLPLRVELLGGQLSISPAVIRTAVSRSRCRECREPVVRRQLRRPRRASDTNILNHGAIYYLPGFVMLAPTSRPTTCTSLVRRHHRDADRTQPARRRRARPRFLGIDCPAYKTVMLYLTQEL